jgi:hypothetical protein
MGKPTVGKYPLVVVVWDDAASSSVEVITEENIAKYHVPTIIKTIGWLVRDDEKGVSVCNESYYEYQGDQPQWRGHTFIPKPLVRSITPFNLARPRKKKEPSNA